MIEVVELIGSALVQDLGRPGLSHLGVSPSGAADRAALRAGNTALGNPATAAGLEVMGAISVRVHDDLLLAVTGAPGAVTVDGVPDDGRVVPAPAGSLVALAAPRWGLRSYLTVRGGLDVEPVLGSRATDTLSGLGPPPVQVGDRLAVLPPAGEVPTSDPTPAPPPPGTLAMLDAAAGPRADWLADPEQLYARPWRVSALADRVGTRLEGEPLLRSVTAELPSEGVVAGSVQVPPSGEPVVLGPDHPTTGGYPVVAVLTAAACDVLAQLRAGTTVRFRHAGPR
ncbi:MAG TPA: biotin-dependent carboxyltransferase family protein [Actinotalea caeni]|uniref:5-oxoprolinase subunit C family protein n=1 Tax=Actinotalea caeni TaxID=1348467 RepID=UPI0012E1D8CA|nr:biotin-dependent carboxyltransferase family protein [Actinotalea caeni]HLV56497.1 biotin-dependent carboxyltransferase family protein [Actinotalea caeni]